MQSRILYYIYNLYRCSLLSLQLQTFFWCNYSNNEHAATNGAVTLFDSLCFSPALFAWLQNYTYHANNIQIFFSLSFCLLFFFFLFPRPHQPPPTPPFCVYYIVSSLCSFLVSQF